MTARPIGAKPTGIGSGIRMGPNAMNGGPTTVLVAVAITETVLLVS